MRSILYFTKALLLFCSSFSGKSNRLFLSFYAYVVLLFISTFLISVGNAQVILPAGANQLSIFHSLSGSGTINGVSFTWSSQSRSGVTQHYGCSIDPVPWIDIGMVTTVTFASPVSLLGFLVWGMDGAPPNNVGTDILQVGINGAAYNLSSSELVSNYVCSDNVLTPGATDIISGNIQATMPAFFGYTVVQLNATEIASLTLTEMAGTSGLGIIGIFVNAGILPITLTNFTGTANDNNVSLGWTTTTESNNNGFKIERSADGTNYTSIGFVSSEAKDGNSSASLQYHFIDNAPYNGINYYKLNQIDFDGTSTFSNTIKIDSKARNTTIRLSPNPSASMINISCVITGSKFAVTDMQGRMVLPYTTSKQVNISGLAKGEYLLQVIQNGNAQAFKFIKQ